MSTPEPGASAPRGCRLKVAHFGPIVAAEVEFRPLTVFVGPNDTGKSYLAALYQPVEKAPLPALLAWRSLSPRWVSRRGALPTGRRRESLRDSPRHLSRGGGLPLPAPLPGRRFAPTSAPRTFSTGCYSLHGNAAWDGVPVDGRSGGEALSVVVADDESPDSRARGIRGWLTGAGPPSPFPADLETALRAACEERLARAVGHELRRCFGVSDLTDLTRWSSSAATAVEWEAPPSAPAASSLTLEISRDSVSASIGNLAPAPPDDHRDWSLSLMAAAKEDEEFQARYLAAKVTRSLLGHGFASLLKPAHHLPAERVGLVRRHEAVVGNLIRGASMPSFHPETRPSPILTGIAADFLERIAAMRPAGEKRRNAASCSDLERDLLGGRIEVHSNFVGYPEFTFRAEASGSRSIPLARTSSAVSGLAPLALYLQGPVGPGDVLVIEEPEAHLHPEKQTALARLFARMIRSGIRLVVTTHSEWLLEKIANLVRISSLPEDRRAGLRDAAFALRAEEVGVWLFRGKKRPRGSVVEEIEVDPESGVYPADYDGVSEALYNEGAEIYNRRQELAHP